ncbi:ABC transporter ATP binding and permease protein [Lactobacillus kullabergensis]|uniref:ABC transporter ATP binding and permease protein n=1 Tax=Lactobacillus kullabergensis TaxID=1218493 RepID=A0A0F4L8F4_9LACO|nr:ABC transporter ATP-binding protein [Lactobacillus kullabergensis]KJY54544.1 ABC transporter ATP binding and permease protein [Lactobacillus kullabergensis]
MTIKDFYKQNPLRFMILILITVLEWTLPIVTTQLIMLETTAIQQQKFQQFLIINVISFMPFLFQYIIQGLHAFLLSKQQEEFNFHIRKRSVSHFYADQKEHSVAQIQNRLTNDLNQSQENYFAPFFSLIGGVINLVSVVVLLISLHWSLLLTIILMVAISLVLPKLLEKPLQNSMTKISKSNNQYLDCLEKWLNGLEELQRYFAGGKLFKVTNDAAKELEDAYVKQNGVTQLLSIINGLVSVSFSLILFLLAGYLFQAKIVAFGAITGVGNCNFYLRQSIQIIVSRYGQIKGSKTLNQEIAQTAAPVKKEQAEEVATPASLSTHDLSLQFPNGESIIFPDINIKSGEKVLLTGDSGAGKSTLFKLILGQIKPTSGQIVFKDKDGAVVNPDMSKIGYIPQDPVLFPVSVADNMTMFVDKLKSALPSLVEKVQLAGDIAKFDEGLNQKIDLNKLNISGGQRQKIVLVRALVHQSEIILIDEGTSAIDQQATMQILHEVTSTPATVIFIAHSFNEQMKQLFDREIHLVKKVKSNSKR